MPPIKKGAARKTVTPQQKAEDKQKKQQKDDTLRQRSKGRKEKPYSEWSNTWRGVKTCQKPKNGQCDPQEGPCTIYKFVNKDVTLSDGKKGTFKQEWCARTSGQAGTGDKTTDNEKRKLLKKHKSIYNAKEASELTQRQATLIGDLIKVSNGKNASLDEAKKYSERLLRSVQKASPSVAASKKTTVKPAKAPQAAKKASKASKASKKATKGKTTPKGSTRKTQRVTQKQRNPPNRATSAADNNNAAAALLSLSSVTGPHSSEMMDLHIQEEKAQSMKKDDLKAFLKSKNIPFKEKEKKEVLVDKYVQFLQGNARGENGRFLLSSDSESVVEVD